MRFFILTILLVFSALVFGQRPEGGGQGSGKKKGPTGEIFGSIQDSLSGQSMSYVSVVALKQPDGKAVGGVVTAEDGSFTLQDLPFGDYHLKISFVGYRKTIIKDISLSEGSSTHQLKDFQLAPSTLKTVEVVGNTPEITFEIDKKVVNVEDQQNTDGMTALEVLENVPSITVSADGTVSLRGSSSFTLLIDGIPTVMEANDALAMIPASTIKDIEIITNPSAKFDAEGTSGVINIITKKSKLEGMSGIVNLSAGRFNNYAADGSINIKRKKIAFDLSSSFNMRSRPNDVTNERITTYDSLVNTLLNTGVSDHNRQSWNVAAGFQWNPNNAHNFVLRSSYGNTLMQFTNYDNYLSYDNDTLLVDQFVTDARAYIPIRNISNSLFYQYNIKRDKNHFISFKAIANLKFVTQNDSTLSYDENNSLASGNIYTEEGPSNMYRFNLDYQLPVKEKFKFQSGLQAQLGQSADISRNYEYNDSLATFELNTLFSSDVKYIRDVFAAYGMFNGMVDKFGFQAGLRAEYTYREINSTQAINFTKINRLDWFPSAHLSYSFDNKSQILLSYSRRIKRPRSWFFEPFITWSSPFSVRSGNPNLLPTYINNFETSFMQPIKNKGFYSFEGYYRINNNIVEWISSVYEDGILINNPYNIGTSQSIGVEGMLDYSFTKWYKANISFNTYYFDLTGALNDVDYSRNSFNWNVRMRHTFDMKGWMLQLNARYNSASVTAQGSSVGVFTSDISLRKSFYKRKLTFNLQARNIFLTSRRESFSTTENVEIHNLSLPRAPYVQLTVSLKLNNYEKFYNSEHLDDF